MNAHAAIDARDGPQRVARNVVSPNLTSSHRRVSMMHLHKHKDLLRTDTHCSQQSASEEPPRSGPTVSRVKNPTLASRRPPALRILRLEITTIVCTSVYGFREILQWHRRYTVQRAVHHRGMKSWQDSSSIAAFQITRNRPGTILARQLNSGSRMTTRKRRRA